MKVYNHSLQYLFSSNGEFDAIEGLEDMLKEGKISRGEKFFLLEGEEPVIVDNDKLTIRPGTNVILTTVKSESAIRYKA